MKTLLKKSALLITLVLTSMVFLSTTKESTLYVKHLRILTVYPHRLGFKVEYVTNTMKRVNKYIPMEWFKNPKSQIIYGNGLEYPYMEVFYDSGEFSHVKLYLIRNYNDLSWSSFGIPSDHDEYFENADTTFRYQ